MDVRQCSECGKLFQSADKKLCIDCLEELDKAFIKTRDYLYKHPNATVPEICEKIGVKEKQIKELLKQDRLSLAGGEPLFQCEACKTPIYGGRLCESCKDKLKTVIDKNMLDPKRHKEGKAQAYEQVNPGSRMYVITKKEIQ